MAPSPTPGPWGGSGLSMLVYLFNMFGVYECWSPYQICRHELFSFVSMPSFPTNHKFLRGACYKHSWRVPSGKSHLRAPARLRTFVAGFQQKALLLTVVRLRMVVTLRIIESDTVFILELCFAKVHIAVRGIVATRLAVPGGLNTNIN